MLPSSSSTPPSSDAASYARTMGSLNALLRESVQHSDPDRMRELAEQIESGAMWVFFFAFLLSLSLSLSLTPFCGIDVIKSKRVSLIIRNGSRPQDEFDDAFVDCVLTFTFLSPYFEYL